MNNAEINPKEIIQPQSNAEKIATFFQKGTATKDLILRLAAINPTVALSNGHEVELGLEDVAKYISHEVNYAKIYYPSGYRYSAHKEAIRQQTYKMEKLFNNHNYPPLIKILLGLATRSWNIADRMDALANKMTPKERAEAQKRYEDNLREEMEISKREKETGKKEEHGFPPELLAVGGDSDRRESRAYLAYAAILAKKVLESR